MNCSIPIDIELSFPFRDLVEKCGRQATWAIVFRLWMDLAAQCRAHGRPGFYPREYQHHFIKAVDGLANDVGPMYDIVGRLKATGLLREIDGGHWVCDLFARHNQQIGRHYLPSTLAWMSNWLKLEKKLMATAHKLTDQLPVECWDLPDGSVITQAVMNRAMVLINTIDIIVHGNPREAKEVGAHMAQRACSIVTSESPALISAVLRRFMNMNRPKQDPMLPVTTEAALDNWSELKVLVTPDEGFEPWVRNLENVQENNQVCPESIDAELAEHLENYRANGI